MEPKKFLFMSLDNLSADLAWTIKKEGHQVKFYVKCPEEREVGSGFVDIVDEYEPYLDWADTIIFDDVLGEGTKAKKLREEGKAVVGGTTYTDQLEDDRSFGQEELKKMGVPVIPYKTFTSFDDAIDYVKSNPGKYVIKPDGEAANVKGLLFIGEDDNGTDVIQVLTDYRNAWSNKIPSFQLQKKMTGVEIAVGAFFNGNEFIYPINVNFEHKKLFPGNLGPSTGEMGTALFWSGPNKIFNNTLKKFEEKLAQEKFVGYIDINCIVNGHGIHPLEWTTRFGYPTISIQQDGILNLKGEFMHSLARGEKIKLRTKTGFQIGVRIVVPPFPFDDPETFRVKSKDSVIHFKKLNYEGIHIEDVKLVNGEWVVTGNAGMVLVVVGMGNTMKQAQAQVYNRINNIIIPHMYYRDDIGDRWLEDSDKLHNWGYLREL
ncbi:phosphoribosylamine--glycine ligase [Candidatus Micrarchaeota archaeon]|jgi:phosphoribosylamine--glycine ligase|nr:phosphoribosylamine--glycine ligase [Candidatus Micrarchaeota archaeon]